ncbi:MAG: hypothetical protein OEW00_11115 [candidate division Zixibacteria bacterium]|nr:hypothetical protein [candidate division Zixibacteria bacterium]
MIISAELMLYCFVAGGLYLLIISVVLELSGRALNVSQYVPGELLEEQGPGWLFMNFVMDYLFFVVIPALAYSYFFLLLPLSGIRVGVAVALMAFTLGMVPLIMGLSVRLKLAMPFLLYFLVGMFLKISGCIIIIGFLYSQ